MFLALICTQVVQRIETHGKTGVVMATERFFLKLFLLKPHKA